MNKTFSDIEKSFNIAGAIPIVGIFSGLIRATAAKIQMLASILLGFFGLIAQVICSGNARKWEDLTHASLEHLVHGALNFIRGMGEMFLGCTIIGSFGLLAYQSGSRNQFNPIIKYSEPLNLSE